jgi:FkbM family methyltransferase
MTPFKNLVNGALRPLSLEIRRVEPPTHDEGPGRDTLEGCLRHARGVGFQPATILDVGAAFGGFTLQCRAVFPNARAVMVEPLSEYRSHLDALAQPGSGVEVAAVAATRESGDIIIHVHPDLVGSSLYLEKEDSNVNGEPRTVPGLTLDELVAERGISGPVLLKIDAQGAEVDILSGASHALELTEYLLLEVVLFDVFAGGAKLTDVFLLLKALGFVPYDVYELHYRLLDGALSQFNVAFVKEGGLFRQDHRYATPEQRREQNERLRVEQSRLGGDA